jgi:MFS family permease
VLSRKLLAWSLGVLFAINVLNFYDRQTPGALAEPIRKEFHLSDTQLGGVTTAFTLLYALVGVPFGRLADSWSRKRLLALGVTVWTGLTAMNGLVSSYGGLVIARLGVGIGEAVCAPTATSWIGDLFPAVKRARALAFFMLGVPIGQALSNTISGPIAQGWSWRAAMILAAAPALLLVPALLLIPEPHRGASEGHVAAEVTPSAWSILRIPTLWWIIASGALVNFNLYALASFLTAFMTRFHGLSVAQSGIWTGIGQFTAGVLGAMSAGVWGDRIIRRRKDGRLLSASAAALLAAPAAFLGVFQPAGARVSAIVLIMVAYGFLNMYYGLVYSSIQDIVSPALRGTTMAIYFMAMYLCGASFGPIITGRLSDIMARRAATAAGLETVTEAARAVGLHDAMYVIPVLSLGLALALYAGSRTIVADMTRRERNSSN